MTAPVAFVIQLRSANGDILPDVTLMATTAMQATLTAHELCPECEIFRVTKADQRQ